MQEKKSLEIIVDKFILRYFFSQVFNEVVVQRCLVHGLSSHRCNLKLWGARGGIVVDCCFQFFTGRGTS